MQRSGCEHLEKLLRAGTLHEKRLKQLRIVRLASASCRLSFSSDRQNLDFFHRLLSKRKASQIAVVRIHVGMSPQDVARRIEDDRMRSPLSGRGEVEVAGGKKISLEPGHIDLVEDTTGKGHITRSMGTEDRVTLTLPLADQSGR